MNFCIYQDIPGYLAAFTRQQKNVFCSGQTSNYCIKTFQKIWIHPNLFKKIYTLHVLLGRNLKVLYLTS